MGQTCAVGGCRVIQKRSPYRRLLVMPRVVSSGMYAAVVAAVAIILRTAAFHALRQQASLFLVVTINTRNTCPTHC